MASHSEKNYGGSFVRHIAPRKCHDCGKPTTDYRCASCLIKWRRKNKIPDEITQILED